MPQILILPGFSPRNKAWADDAESHLKNIGEVVKVYWRHWQTRIPMPGWINHELAKIRTQLSSQPIMIVAKSIGTLVATKLLAENTPVSKLVLCGLPINDLNPDDLKLYRHLEKVDPGNILVLQNNADPHGNDTQVVDLFKQLNLNLKIQSQVGDDHEYPYWDQMESFLK